MKYILRFLVSSVIVFIILTILMIWQMGKENEIQNLKAYSFDAEPPKIINCIGLDIKLLGSFEEFKKIHDAYECKFKADVAVTLDSITKYYTFEDFEERLGFVEWLKKGE